MTKPEKYSVFGMIAMISVTHKEIPTLLNSISNVLAYACGVVFFIMALWCVIRGAK